MHGISRKLPLVLVWVIASLAAARLDAGPWMETARLFHSGGSAGDTFGSSVAIDGDVAVVAAYGNSSGFPDASAYVFVRSGGVWSETAALTVSGGAKIGPVAISGDTIVLGLLPFRGGPYTAQVYVRPVGGWAGVLTESATLHGLQGADLNFGASVAIDGDVIVVGTPDTIDTGPGRAFVFAKPPSGWSGDLFPSAALIASNGSTGDGLGLSVAISGNTVVAGAPTASDGNSLVGDGRAYVFVEPSQGWAGIFTEAAKLRPSTPLLLGHFGTAVAMAGTTAVVTENYQNSSDPDNHNQAYAFEMPSGGWSGTLTENALLLGTDAFDAFSSFGASVSISGDTVVVGEPNGATPFTVSGGAAFIFDRPSTGWSGLVGQFAKIYLGSGASSEFFGTSVAISGSTIVAGAPNETVGANAFQGAAHVFEPGLNPTVTTSFVPGSVLTYQPSRLTLTITNPNTSGFIWNVSAGATLSVPAGLFPAAVPNLSNACGGLFILGGTNLLGFVEGDPLPAGGTCAISADFSSGTPNLYTTSALPVFCDQGCDGVGSAPVTLLVRLRNTQTRFLVEGPIRVAPGVPVELRFQVESRPETALPISGEVVVSDGAGHACRSDLSAGGQGACTLTFDSPGAFQVRASYLGDLSFGGSTSPPANVFVR